MTTYTGTTGRIVGIVWGSFWVAVGVGATVVIADILISIPQGVERLVTQYAPWLLTIAPPDASPIAALFFGIFAVVGLLMGPYEIVRAVTSSEYRISLSSSSDPDP